MRQDISWRGDSVRAPARLALAALATTSFLSAPLAVAGTVASWISPVSGAWTDSSRWSSAPFFPNNGSPSGASYDAVVGAAGGPETGPLGGKNAPGKPSPQP